MFRLAGILILVAIISAVFNWYQEHKSSQVLKSISSLLPTDVVILRDGQEQPCSALDVVVGDIVILKTGDRIPADVRYFDVRGARADRSVLTGESEPVSCSTSCTDKNFLQVRGN